MVIIWARRVIFIGAAWLGLNLAMGVAPAVGEPAAGMFLVAAEQLQDPHFRESVVLVTQHGRGGTVGVVLNRTTALQLQQFFPELEATPRLNQRVYWGGPVASPGLVYLLRSDTPVPKSLRVAEGLYLSADGRQLRDLVRESAPGNTLRAFRGYAGWAPGQLQAEIQRGDWHLAPVDVEQALTEHPKGLWQRLIDKVKGHWVYHLLLPGIARG